MALTILEGSTFCISDDLGDFDGASEGLFAADTRFLSCWRLTLNGARPHQGMQQRIPTGTGGPVLQLKAGGKVQAVPVLGGLHHTYQRAA